MKLQRRQLGVDATHRDQRCMRTGLDDVAVIKNDDAIRALHGREPMRDDERGAPGHRCFQRALQQTFRFRSQRAGGFIEQ